MLQYTRITGGSLLSDFCHLTCQTSYLYSSHLSHVLLHPQHLMRVPTFYRQAATDTRQVVRTYKQRLSAVLGRRLGLPGCVVPTERSMLRPSIRYASSSRGVYAQEVSLLGQARGYRAYSLHAGPMRRQPSEAARSVSSQCLYY